MFGWAILALTDGVTRLDLIDNRAYSLLAGWAPKVAPRRVSLLGGRGPWADVDEQIVLQVLGSTPAAVYQNLVALTTLLDQAARWAAGDPGVLPVRLVAKPICGSASPALESVVVAVPPETASAAVPVSEAGRGLFALQGVTITFRRQGTWTAAEETSSTSASAQIGNVHTVSFAAGAQALVGPMKLAFSGYTQNTIPLSATNRLLHGSYIVVTEAATNIHVIEGESFTRTSGYTVSTVADTLARGGNVLRVTGDASFKRTILDVTVPNSAGTFGAGASQVSALIVLRASTAADTWSVTTEIHRARVGFTSAPIPLDQVTTPQILVVPVDLTPAGVNGVRLYLDATAAGTLDIDYVVLVNETPTTRIVAVHASEFASAFASGTTPLQIQIDAGAPTRPRPTVRLVAPSTGEFVPLPYTGDIWLPTTGASVSAIMVAADNSIRAANASAAVWAHQVTATRQVTHLLPQ